MFSDCKNRLTIPFEKNTKRVFTLDPGLKILRGTVLLRGQVVISGGSASGALVGEGGPANLIQRIRVIATAASGSRYLGGTIVDATPRGLLRHAINEHNGKFFADLNGSSLGSGAAATYQVYCAIPIYWASSLQRNDYATALPMDLVDSTGVPIWSSVQVEVTTGDLTTCFAGNDRVFDYSGLSVDWIDHRLAIPGDTNLLVQEEHYLLIDGAQERKVDAAMPQSGAFLSWLVMAEAGGSANTLSDAILQKITASGSTFNLELWANDFRQKMLEDEWLDPSQAGTGLYFIDFADGLLKNGNPAPGIAAQFRVLNPSGLNLDQLRIFTRRFYPPLGS